MDETKQSPLISSSKTDLENRSLAAEKLGKRALIKYKHRAEMCHMTVLSMPNCQWSP